MVSDIKHKPVQIWTVVIANILYKTPVYVFLVFRLYIPNSHIISFNYSTYFNKSISFYY